MSNFNKNPDAKNREIIRTKMPVCSNRVPRGKYSG
jgi:hypothetical protein